MSLDSGVIEKKTTQETKYIVAAYKCFTMQIDKKENNFNTKDIKYSTKSTHCI